MSSCNPIRTLLIIACLCGVVRGSAQAQLLKGELPTNAQGVDVEDRVGEFIPLDLSFRDETGSDVELGSFFGHSKPIVLTLNYSNCPGLCIAQLDNLVSTLKEFNCKGLGEEFEIVTVSIDPQESYGKAALTKKKYVSSFADETVGEGWHFLTGDQEPISKLAEAVGFKYTYDTINKRYNHPAAIYFVSSDGRVCRYLLSLGVEPNQFQLAVTEAKDGILTMSVADAIVQLCYLYDPDANRYAADARRIMAFGGAAFVLLVLGGTAPFWFTRKQTNVGQNKVADSSVGSEAGSRDAQAANESASEPPGHES